VTVAWPCYQQLRYQQLRSICHATHPATGRAIAEKVIASFATTGSACSSLRTANALPPNSARKALTILSGEAPNRRAVHEVDADFES
jgi:hypothetical protein